jgi:hypothetical protein
MSKNTSTSAYKILTNPTKHMGVMSDIVKKLDNELKKQGFRFYISGESMPLVGDWFGYVALIGATKTLVFVLGYDEDATASIRYTSMSSRTYYKMYADGFVPGIITRALEILYKEPLENHYHANCPMETKKDLVESCVETIHEYVIESTCPSYCQSYEYDDVMFKWLVNAAMQAKPNTQALAHVKQYMSDAYFQQAIKDLKLEESLLKLKPCEMSDDSKRAGSHDGIDDDDEED